MKGVAQVKLEINIDANKRTVKIIGKTIIDGKTILNYDKNIDEAKNKAEQKRNGIYIDDIVKMLNKPLDIDPRFKGVTGIN